MQGLSDSEGDARSACPRGPNRRYQVGQLRSRTTTIHSAKGEGQGRGSDREPLRKTLARCDALSIGAPVLYPQPVLKRSSSTW